MNLATTRDALACSICFEKFNITNKQPLLLHCFHSFCQGCLQRIAKPSKPPTPSSSSSSSSLPSHPPPSPSGPQSSITCPLCSKVTLCASASSLSINYALKDVVEATSAMSEDRPCELHDDQHPATYWCFECEQGMCHAAHVIHGKAKSSKHHQTSEIGSTSPPVVRKQVTCTVHGKETNLVCTHPSHSPSPQMICISCVVTSHQSHPCMTAADFFVGRQAETQALLKHARVAEERLARVAEVVWKEHASVAQNRDSVRTSIYGYFTKAHHELDNHHKQLLTLLDSTSVSKEEVLAKQGEGLLATLDGIKRASLQLEVALSSDSQAKALVLMQQLQQHLKSIEENDLQPRDLAGMTLHEVSYSPPEVYLVDAKASEASVTSTGSSFPVILSTCIPLSRFEINGIMKGEALRLQTTSAGEGRYNIQAEEVSLEEQIVHVRLLGQHIKGSPVRIPGKRSWSPTNTARTVITDSKLEAKEPGAWGMVREEFGMSPRSLIIRIDHQKTNKWAQLALYTSSTVQLNAGYELPDNIATYNTNPKAKNAFSTLKLQREKHGQVTLHHDDIFVWQVYAPICYVYVDIFHSTTVAEILQ